ncbi:hypothetical protein EQP49_13065 [Yersinia sp. 2105 StPb PI]|nr:hypothetical protein EQP49_13065 [Yersinia sp. 2105 StPb PI]
MINVQFSDKKKTKIVSYFSGSQDTEAHDFLGEIESSDPLWAEFYDAIPESSRHGLPAPE